MQKILLFLAFAIAITTINMAKAQTYDPYAVQVIKNLLINNAGLTNPGEPEDWTFHNEWDDNIPKQLIILSMYDLCLKGEITIEELHSLQWLSFGDNNLTELNVKNCSGLKRLSCGENLLTKLNIINCASLEFLDCSRNSLTELDLKNITTLNSFICSYTPLSKLILPNNASFKHLSIYSNNLNYVDISVCAHVDKLYVECNRLTELDLTGLDDITVFSGDNQNVSLTLYKNEKEYTHSILLNNPSFEHDAISYMEGILKSSDNTVDKTNFTVQTIGNNNYQLSGTMNFIYSNVGIKNLESIQPKVYPNPTKDIFFIDNETLANIMLYDMLGKKVLTQSGYGKTEINISHLTKGIYIVALFSEGKLVGNTKIVKQ